MFKSFTKDPWSIDSSGIVVYTPSPGDPTFVGTTGNNTFNISAGSPNIVFGLGGNDKINISGGDNFIYSGDFTTKYNTGNDTITLLNETSSNYNYINYGNSNDTISITGNSQNFIMGGIGNANLTVTTATGAVGATTTDLGPGNDTVKLGGGNDSALFNVSLDGAFTGNNYDAGAGTDTLSLAFASVADLNTFTSVYSGAKFFGPNFVNFASMDASTFNFGKYDNQLGFDLNLKVTHFEHLVLDVNPTAAPDTATVSVSLTDIPSTPFLLANDVGYQGHSLNLSSMSAPVSSNPSLLTVTADYAAFAPTLGNPLNGEFATFDLTPQGSSQHALLTIFNNGNYSITNVAALDSVVQANPGIHLSFNYTNGDGFGGHASSTGTINFIAHHDVIGPNQSTIIAFGTEGSSFSFSTTNLFNSLFTQSEPNDPYSLAVSGLPAGLTYSSATGITGTIIAEKGTFDIQVTATNTDPNEPTHSSFTSSFQFLVNDAHNEILATTPLNVTQTENDSINLAIAGLFSSDDPMSFTLDPHSAPLPAGLSINGSGSIVGTLIAEPGTYTVTIDAKNLDPSNAGDPVVSNTVSFVVNDAHNEVTANAPMPPLSETIGVPLSNVSVAGLFSSDDPLAFSIDPASASLLPAGLTLDATSGAITGAITAAAGTYVVTIDATNQDPNNPVSTLDPVVPNTITFNVASPASIAIDNSLVVPEQTTIPLSPSHDGNLFAGDGVLVGQLSDTASGTPHFSVVGGAFLDGSATPLAVNPFEVIGDSLVLIPGDSVPIGFHTATISIDDGLGHQQTLTLTENTSPSIIAGSATGDGGDGGVNLDGVSGSASISDTSANDLLVGVNGGNGGDGLLPNGNTPGGNGGSGSYTMFSMVGHDTIYGGDGGNGGNDAIGPPPPPHTGHGGEGSYIIDASANLSSVVIYGGDGGNGGLGPIGGIGFYEIKDGAGNDIIYAGNGGNEGPITGGSGFYIIDAGSGNDTIFMGTGGNGQTALSAGHYEVNGGAGNDTIHFGLNSSFTTGMSINGGTGVATFVTDTPLATASTLDAAVTAPAGSQLTNITHLDLATTNNDPNSTALSAQDVLNMTPASHTLFVEGTSNDTVTLAPGWSPAAGGGTVNEGGINYSVFQESLNSVTVSLFIEHDPVHGMVQIA